MAGASAGVARRLANRALNWGASGVTRTSAWKNDTEVKSDWWWRVKRQRSPPIQRAGFIDFGKEEGTRNKEVDKWKKMTSFIK